jgi:uncharacterized repeat protein (TIGR04052 family)
MFKTIAMRLLVVLILVGVGAPVLRAQQAIEVRFKGLVGKEALACGKEYPGIGASSSKITPKDFRFYVRDLRVLDDKGAVIPVDLDQDGKWQLDRIALLDFEDRTGRCEQGTPDMNDRIKGTVPSGTIVKGVRFRLGLPPERNHAPSIRNAPAPLNLSAMIWSWSTGYLFVRMDYEKVDGAPRSFAVHLGDIQDNLPWPDIEFKDFDLSKDAVAADFAAAFVSVNIERNGGCMHNCPTVLTGFGINGTQPQTFFRKVSISETP